MREAIVNFTDDQLETIGFAGLVSAVREAGLRDVDLLEDHGDTCVPQVVVEDRLDGDALADLECVDDWDLIAEREGAYVYLLELTATELPEGTGEDHGALLGACEASATDRGLLLSLVGSQDAIRDLLRDYQAAGATPDLRKLAEYEGERNLLDELTDRQREVLETAYGMGFYEVPREASVADVADEVGLDDTTVSEHLQRAERNLLTRQLTA